MSATLVERPTFTITDTFADIAYCTQCHSYDMGCDEIVCHGLDCD